MQYYPSIAICWVLWYFILQFFSPFSTANHFPKVKLSHHHPFYLIRSNFQSFHVNSVIFFFIVYFIQIMALHTQVKWKISWLFFSHPKVEFVFATFIKNLCLKNISTWCLWTDVILSRKILRYYTVSIFSPPLPQYQGLLILDPAYTHKQTS